MIVGVTVGVTVGVGVGDGDGDGGGGSMNSDSKFKEYVYLDPGTVIIASLLYWVLLIKSE